MKRCCTFLACLATILSGAATAGPVGLGYHQPARLIAPQPAPQATLDEIIAALYDGVSGDAGQPRDWEAFSRLFVPGARLTNTTRVGAAHGLAGEVLDVAQFAALNDRLLQGRGFYEREVHRETATYGGIAHVWSVYESRRTREGEPYARGANSLQLLRTTAGWRILSVTWDHETPAQPLTQRFPQVASLQPTSVDACSGESATMPECER